MRSAVIARVHCINAFRARVPVHLTINIVVGFTIGLFSVLVLVVSNPSKQVVCPARAYTRLVTSRATLHRPPRDRMRIGAGDRMCAELGQCPSEMYTMVFARLLSRWLYSGHRSACNTGRTAELHVPPLSIRLSPTCMLAQLYARYRMVYAAIFSAWSINVSSTGLNPFKHNSN